eukprot:3212520-Prymnesium_polylepis.1
MDIGAVCARARLAIGPPRAMPRHGHRGGVSTCAPCHRSARPCRDTGWKSGGMGHRETVLRCASVCDFVCVGAGRGLC